MNQNEIRSQIEALLTRDSAANITNKIKTLGNGDMINGLNKLCTISEELGVQKAKFQCAKTNSVIWGLGILVLSGISVAYTQYQRKKEKEMLEKLKKELLEAIESTQDTPDTENGNRRIF